MKQRAMPKPEINMYRRQLMLKVVDNTAGIPPILFFWNQFRQCDEMLEWCVRNRLTGREFMMWHDSIDKRGMLAPVKVVLMHIEKQKTERAILVGPDFQPS